MNGLEVFREMKKINPDLRALVCTGYSLPATSEEILAEGFRGLLQQPFTSKELIKLITSIHQSSSIDSFWASAYHSRTLHSLFLAQQTSHGEQYV